jgi:hypothetical protein
MKDLYLSFSMRYQPRREKQTRGHYVVATRDKMRVINSHAALYGLLWLSRNDPLHLEMALGCSLVLLKRHLYAALQGKKHHNHSKTRQHRLQTDPRAGRNNVPSLQYHVISANAAPVHDQMCQPAIRRIAPRYKFGVLLAGLGNGGLQRRGKDGCLPRALIHVAIPGSAHVVIGPRRGISGSRHLLPSHTSQHPTYRSARASSGSHRRAMQPRHGHR